MSCSYPAPKRPRSKFATSCIDSDARVACRARATRTGSSRVATSTGSLLSEHASWAPKSNTSSRGSGSDLRRPRVIEITVLGCSGSYGAPAGGACSGYLVRAGGTTIWLDCGNGSFANLQQHARVEDLDAVVISHGHPDHCVDIYGLHVLYKYGL